MNSMVVNKANGAEHRRRRIRDAMNSRTTVWRLAWAAMLLLHLPATIAVFSRASLDGTGAAWSSLVLLTATNAFFLFEIIFAKSLRLLANRRCLVVFLLIVTLLHAGVIDRVMPDAVPEHGVGLWLIVSVGAAALLQSALVQVMRLAQSRVIDRGHGLALARHRYARRAFTPTIIPKASPFRSATTLRAPPSY